MCLASGGGLVECGVSSVVWWVSVGGEWMWCLGWGVLQY